SHMRLPLLIVLSVLAPSASADGLWAGMIPLPAGYQPTEGTLISHAFDQGTFTIGSADAMKRGKYNSGYLTRLPEGFHEPADAAIKKWQPVLTAKGWALKGRSGEGFTFQKVDGAVESWLNLNLAEYQDPKLTLVQSGATPRKQ